MRRLLDHPARTWLHAYGITPGPVLVAVALWIAWYRRPVALVDPPDCRGALDLTLAILLRGFDGMSVGAVLGWTNGVIAFAALAAFTCLVRALTGSLLITAACGAALIATPAFERVLGPAETLAVLAAVCVAALAAHRLTSENSAAPTGRKQMIGATAAIALITPRLLLPAVLVIIWTLVLDRSLARRRVAAAIAVTAGVAAAATVGAQASLNGLSTSPTSAAFACIWQRGWNTDVAPERIALAAGAIGPFPFAVAALGAFGFLGGLTKTQRSWVIVALAASLLAAWRASDASGLIPALAGFWCLVALGLRELMAEGTTQRARRIAAAIILALLPILQIERLRQQDPPAAPSVYGHGDLSQDALWRTLRTLPDVNIVAEDASTDLVLRASVRQLGRSGKALRLIPRDARAVAEALRGGHVFAFPRAQVELQHRGVEFKTSRRWTIGLAEVDRVHPCTPLERRLRDAPAAAIAARFALVALAPDARGPVTIYLAGPAPFTAAPLGWRDREKRGFHVRSYLPTDLAELRATLTAQGLAPSSPLLSSAHVVRLTMWRTPGAPAVLPVALTDGAQTAVARVEEMTDQPALELCASSLFEPERIERGNR